MYRIMLADDEGIVLDSLRMIIEENFPGNVRLRQRRPEGRLSNWRKRFDRMWHLWIFRCRGLTVWRQSGRSRRITHP